MCWEKGLNRPPTGSTKIELLPIGGKWLSANSTVPYLRFPTSEESRSPPTLGLHLLDADALYSADRKKLFASSEQQRLPN